MHLKEVLKGNGFASWPKAISGSKPGDKSKILMEVGWHGLFGITVDVNPFKPGSHSLSMTVPLFKPLSEQAFRDLQKADRLIYKKFIYDIVKATNPYLQSVDVITTPIYDFELEIMKATTEDSRTTKINYVEMKLKDLDRNIPGLKWNDIIRHPFNFLKMRLADSQSVFVWRLTYYNLLAAYIKNTVNPEVLFNYLGWKFIVELLPFTRKTLYGLHSNFMRSVDPTFNQLPADETCVTDLMKNMGFILGRLYIRNYFKYEALSDVDELITYLKEAAAGIFTGKDWLDESTKAAAFQKVQQMLQLVGYPNWLISDAELERLYKHVPDISESMSYVSAMNITIRNNFLVNLEQIQKPADRKTIFPQSPAVINGEYLPHTNALVLYAGLLQTPFYEHQIPFSVKMGVIGWIAAHEITHGFDTLGSQYDWQGELKSWWTKQVEEKFKTKAHCFINQYSAITDPETKVQACGTYLLTRHI
ncbi:unnamed protein product, partial [Ixodes hexagonus]